MALIRRPSCVSVLVGPGVPLVIDQQHDVIVILQDKGPHRATSGERENVATREASTHDAGLLRRQTSTTASRRSWPPVPQLMPLNDTTA